MKVLFVSMTGELLPLAERVEGEGHSVTLHICDQMFLDRGRGHVKSRSATSVEPILAKDTVNQKAVEKLIAKTTPDLCVCDSGMGRVGEIIKRLGIKTWGADRWSELVYGDYEANLLKSIDVSALPQPTPSDAQFAVGAFSDGDILYNPFLAVSESRLQNRSVGVDVDGGVCVQALHAGHPLLKILEKIEEVCKKVSYKGIITLGNHLCVGFSLPLFACLHELTKDKVTNILKGDKCEMVKEWASATRISLPPFPIPINEPWPQPIAIHPKAKKHAWLKDVANGDAGVVNGDLGWVTARGGEQQAEEFTPLRESRRRILRTISNLKSENSLDDLQYRTDIGVRSAEVLAGHQAKD